MNGKLEFKVSAQQVLMGHDVLFQTGVEGWEIAGVPAPFNNRDTGGDVICPGAFAATLRERKLVPMYLSHTSDPCGRWDILVEDADIGLLAKGTIAKTTRGRDLRELASTGITVAMSIGFVAEKSYYGDYHGQTARYLQVIDLREISIVQAGMNPKALIGAQSCPPQVLRDKLLCAKSEKRVLAGRATVEETKMYIDAQTRITNREGFLLSREHEAKVARLFSLEELFGPEGARSKADWPEEVIDASAVLRVRWLLGGGK
jgi:hypothetical protein